jgi:phosphoglycolate phosphatase
MKFKAILFDLDGTLLDSINDLANSMNSVLKRFGFPIHHAEKYKYFVGDGVERLVRRSLPERIIDESTILNVMTEYRKEYSNRWAETTKPYPGIPELLEGLSKIGISMNVLSNKPDETTKAVIKKFFPDYKFDIVAGALANIPEKPDPAGAIKIAENLGLDPSVILYLGDTNTDMKTAKGAGMFPVGALWGFRTGEELRESGAEVLIKYPLDLIRFFK